MENCLQVEIADSLQALTIQSIKDGTADQILHLILG